MVIIIGLAHFDFPPLVFFAAALVARAAKLPLATWPLPAFAVVLWIRLAALGVMVDFLLDI
jgi:hypothetical protein